MRTFSVKLLLILIFLQEELRITQNKQAWNTVKWAISRKTVHLRWQKSIQCLEHVFWQWPEAYSELCQTSKMDFFVKIVNDFQKADIFHDVDVLLP